MSFIFSCLIFCYHLTYLYLFLLSFVYQSTPPFCCHDVAYAAKKMAFITRESNPNEAITVSHIYTHTIYRRPLKSHAQMFGVRECCTKKLFQTVYVVEDCNEMSVKPSKNLKMCSTIALTVQTKLFILPLPCE